MEAAAVEPLCDGRLEYRRQLLAITPTAIYLLERADQFNATMVSF